MAIEKNEEGRYAVDIDGASYSFEKYGAEESLETLLKIAKIAGKPLGLAISAFLGDKDEKEKSILEREMDPDLLATAFEALTTALDEKVVMALVKKFSSDRVLCNGAKIVFNTHYEDRLDLLFKVVKAALEVQYGNFFSALSGLIPVKRSKSVQNLPLSNRNQSQPTV